MNAYLAFRHSRTFARFRTAAWLLALALPLVSACGKSNDKPAADDVPAKSNGDSKQAARTSTATATNDKPITTPATPNAAGDNANPAPAEATPPTDEPAAEPAPPALDDAVRTPATVAEAAAVLDLRKLPIPADVENPGLSIASAYFETKLDEKAAFDAVAKFFAGNEWKLYHDVQAYPGSISAGYAREGFRVAVSVFTAGQGKTTVSVNNLGNVNLAKLPVPEHAKVWYAFGDTASYLTEVGVDETREDMKKLLLADGWQPYGGAGDVVNFKKNATLIGVRVMSPPTQAGKTAISFSSDQLSADLPAPPTASRVQYSDRPTQISVDAPLTPDELATFYRESLAAAHWQATTENTIKDRNEHTLIFRNPAKDMLTLTMREIEDEKLTRYALEFLSAEEVAKLDQQVKELAETAKREREAEANKPKPKVAVALPAEAKDVESEENQLEFKLASGAKAAAEAIAKSLEADGWKSDATAATDPTAGQISLTKDAHAIAIFYVEPGVIPAQVTITGIGIAVEPKK